MRQNYATKNHFVKKELQVSQYYLTNCSCSLQICAICHIAIVTGWQKYRPQNLKTCYDANESEARLQTNCSRHVHRLLYNTVQKNLYLKYNIRRIINSVLNFTFSSNFC